MKINVFEESIFTADEKGHYFTWLCQIGEKIFRIKSYGIGRAKKIILLWEENKEEFYRLERVFQKESYRPKEYFFGKQKRNLKNDQNCFFIF